MMKLICFNYCLKIGALWAVLFIGNLSFLTASNGRSDEKKESERIIWYERPRGDWPQMMYGIPAQAEKTIEYHKDGRKLFDVHLETPVVVQVADKPQPWGYYQFPALGSTLEGQLVASWSQQEDDVRAYGTGGVGFSISPDQGKTWVRTDQPPAMKWHELSNGDMIAINTPKAQHWKELGLTPIRQIVGSGREYSFFKHEDLPADLQGVYISRLAKGAVTKQYEHSTIEHPGMLRYADGDYLPIVWWGDMQNMADGSVIIGIYPGYSLNAAGKVNPSEIHFYRSTDAGKTWNIHSAIPYWYDPVFDAVGAKRAALLGGFTEPSFKILSNDTYLCVMRSHDNLGHSPIYSSNSFDEGKTWTQPHPATATGVYPKLLELDNGVIAMGSGRPGAQIRFSVDGLGKEWSDSFELVGDESNMTARWDVVTCGYTGFLKIDANSFFIIYSDFLHKTPAGDVRKAIKIRKVTVTKY